MLVQIKIRLPVAPIILTEEMKSTQTKPLQIKRKQPTTNQPTTTKQNQPKQPTHKSQHIEILATTPKYCRNCSI